MIKEFVCRNVSIIQTLFCYSDNNVIKESKKRSIAIQKKMYTMLIAALMIGVVFTGCGNSKETGNDADVNGTEISQTTQNALETEIIEVVKDVTMTENEDGSLVVETDTGEQVVIDDDTKVTENEDGSKTYEKEDGTKIDVTADGQTTVTTEEKVPVDTQIPPAKKRPMIFSSFLDGNGKSSCRITFLQKTERKLLF